MFKNDGLLSYGLVEMFYKMKKIIMVFGMLQVGKRALIWENWVNTCVIPESNYEFAKYF